MIVEPNEDEEERKSADKIRINYGIGRRVLISYNGEIMETYPAQINTNNISINGYSDFEIEVKESQNVIKKKILNNGEINKDNQKFDLYYYGLDEVNVKVDNKTRSLEEALKSGKITIDGIIEKANKELKETKEKYSKFEDSQSVPRLFPYYDVYKDGGSIIYYYENYTILKFNTIVGNKDVYIGNPKMTIKVK